MGNIYVGKDSIARNPGSMYVGVDGIARKIQNIYVGDTSGIARQAYTAFTPPSYSGYLFSYGNDTQNANPGSKSFLIPTSIYGDLLSNGYTKVSATMRIRNKQEYGTDWAAGTVYASIRGVGTDVDWDSTEYAGMYETDYYISKSWTIDTGAWNLQWQGVYASGYEIYVGVGACQVEYWIGFSK